MSIVDLVRAVVGAGTLSLVAIALLPLAVGAVAGLLRSAGHRGASQLVANAGIAIGFTAVLVTICSVVWASQHGASPLVDVAAVWWVAPIWLLGAGLFVEHRLHPGRQESIRGPLRRAALVVIVLAVVYWLLSTMRVWMLVHTGVIGLLLFLGALECLGLVV